MTKAVSRADRSIDQSINHQKTIFLLKRSDFYSSDLYLDCLHSCLYTEAIRSFYVTFLCFQIFIGYSKCQSSAQSAVIGCIFTQRERGPSVHLDSHWLLSAERMKWKRDVNQKVSGHFETICRLCVRAYRSARLPADSER